MLATQLNDLVVDQKLDKNVVVKLTKFVTNAVQGRKSVIPFPANRTQLIPRLIIILELEVQDWKGDKIGNPSNLEQAATSAAAAAPAGGAGAGAGAAPAANRGAPARATGAAGGRSGKDMGPIFPIEGLSPYQNK